jgi:hypothetical protein
MTRLDNVIEEAVVLDQSGFTFRDQETGDEA